MSDQIASTPLNGPTTYDFGQSTPDDWPRSYVAETDYMQLVRRIETLKPSSIEDWVRQGYRLHVRWRSHEQRFHAYVDLGDIHTSHNFMGESLDEALAGLERYLASHAEATVPDGQVESGK